MMNTSNFLRAGVNLQPRPNMRTEQDGIVSEIAFPAKPARQRLTVDQMLAKIPNLPHQTAILGMCDDGLPVLFDLQDDHPGPLLVTGDSACGKTALMKGMLETAIRSNSPYEVKYAVISSNPEEWDAFSAHKGNEHCLAFNAYYEDNAGQTILRLAEIAEQRRCGREEGAAILMMIDDVRFISKADYDVRLNFEWLLKSGPTLQIWPVVSLPTQAALDMSRLVSHFRTRLIGHIAAKTHTRLSLYPGLDTENLESGKQFAVRVQEQWMNFTVPAQG